MNNQRGTTTVGNPPEHTFISRGDFDGGAGSGDLDRGGSRGGRRRRGGGRRNLAGLGNGGGPAAAVPTAPGSTADGTRASVDVRRGKDTSSLSYDPSCMHVVSTDGTLHIVPNGEVGNETWVYFDSECDVKRLDKSPILWSALTPLPKSVAWSADGEVRFSFSANGAERKLRYCEDTLDFECRSRSFSISVLPLSMGLKCYAPDAKAYSHLHLTNVLEGVKVSLTGLKADLDGLELAFNKLRAENDKLRAESDKLRTENDKLRAEKDALAALRADDEKLRAKKEKLHAETEALRATRLAHGVRSSTPKKKRAGKHT
jgi:hypothetical protein